MSHVPLRTAPRRTLAQRTLAQRTLAQRTLAQRMLAQSILMERPDFYAASRGTLFAGFRAVCIHFLSHDRILLRVPGELLQQVVLEVLVRHLRNQQLQQEVQEAEDQMSEGTHRLH